jgi:hypothetical protein
MLEVEKMEKKEDKLEKAKKIAKSKVEFIRHLGIYVVVMVILAVINNITSPGYQWWLWPAGFWGLGVIINFMVVFLLKGGGLKKLEEQLTEKELEKMKDE